MEKEIQEQIIDVIERLHQAKITTKNRKRSNVTARAVYAKLCKDIFPYLTLSKIAEPINRDHATIIHMFKAIDSHLKNDNEYINLYKKASVIINKDVIATQNVKEISYLESLEERLIRMSNALIEKNKEIEQLKGQRTTDKYKLFEALPDELFDTFVETRLKPYLKLNG
jgi:chromosomal replication initiation ATPase DnaA